MSHCPSWPRDRNWAPKERCTRRPHRRRKGCFDCSLCSTLRGPNARVEVVTNSIGIVVLRAIAVAIVKFSGLVAVAIAVSLWNVRASAVVNRTGAVAHPAFVQDVAVAVTAAFREVCASACVNLTRTVAHPTRVEGTHARVDVVAKAIAVLVCGTGSAACAQGVVVETCPIVGGGIVHKVARFAVRAPRDIKETRPVVVFGVRIKVEGVLTCAATSVGFFNGRESAGSVNGKGQHLRICAKAVGEQLNIDEAG